MRRAAPDDGLRGVLVRGIVGPHWQPIELGLRAAGVPDLSGCWDGTEVWIECKSARHWEVSLRPGQIGWILRRTRAGGRCVVAVRRRVADADELWIFAGERVRELRLQGLRERVGLLGYWRGGPAEWAWPHVRRALFERQRGQAPLGATPPAPARAAGAPAAAGGSLGAGAPAGRRGGLR
jgi:hypothetical protein